jgi:hypothetical protein
MESFTDASLWGPPVPGFRAKVANRGRYLKVRSTAKSACPAVDRYVGDTGRNDSVDIGGLRAVAIVPVIAFHAFLAARVIGADVFVVRHEYYRMDFVRFRSGDLVS